MSSKRLGSGSEARGADTYVGIRRKRPAHNGARGPAGDLLHDDFVLADSLVSKLDQLKWYIHTLTAVVDTHLEPLKREMRF